MKIYRSSERSDFERAVKFFILALLVAMILSLTGCGIRNWSASTEATYEVSPDGKKITYESNKEFQGLILEVTDNSVKITVDKASTSEAAIAAALQMQLSLQRQLMQLIDQLAPLAAKAGT